MQQRTILILGTFDPGDSVHRATTGAVQHAAAHRECVANTRWMGPDDMALYPGLVAEASAVVLAPPAISGARTLSRSFLGGLKEVREGGLPLLATGVAHALVFVEAAGALLGLQRAGGACFGEASDEPVVHSIPRHGSSEPETGALRAIELRVVEGAPSWVGAAPAQTVGEQTDVPYGLNPDYAQALEAAGLKPLAVEAAGGRPYLHALEGHPFFVAAAYLPQLASRPDAPHPLFAALMAAALARGS